MFAAAYLATLGKRARSGLCRWRVGWLAIRGVITKAMAAAAVLVLLLWCFYPENLLYLPRNRPNIWALVMVFYPVFSVFPQGLLYRALFFERYASLWGGALRGRLAGAAAFSLAHLMFANAWAMGFTFVGGWIFAGTYARSRSFPLSCIEHALYGQLIFTIGWGQFLYHGTQAVVDKL